MSWVQLGRINKLLPFDYYKLIHVLQFKDGRGG